MNEKKENLEKKEEQILNPQEIESVEGGVSSLELSKDAAPIDDNNFLQCSCNNYQCGKAVEQQ